MAREGEPFPGVEAGGTFKGVVLEAAADSQGADLVETEGSRAAEASEGHNRPLMPRRAQLPRRALQIMAEEGLAGSPQSGLTPW